MRSPWREKAQRLFNFSLPLMLHRLLHFRLTLLLTLVVLVVCLLPIPETPLDEVRFIDKYTHLLLFGGYAWVLWAESALSARAARPEAGARPAKTPLRRSLWALALGWPVCFGGLVEVLQATLTTCRSGDWLDFAADALGVFCAALLGVPTYRALIR